MTDHERLREQYEDALFALLMEGVAESEGEEALRLNEELKKDPNAEVPKDVQKRCEKTIRSAFAQKQLRATGRTAARWLTKVAVVAVLGGLMFTAAFALSEDVRVATLNALIQVMDDRTEITFEGIQTEGQQPPSETVSGLDYHYNIALEWVPEGFELEGGKTGKESADLVSYISQSDGLIEVSVTPYASSSTYNLNTEGCIKRDIIVQGQSATLYIADDEMIQKRFGDIGMTNIWSDQMIYWIDEEEQVIVQVDATNLTEDEMLQLAEGVHWRNDI